MKKFAFYLLIVCKSFHLAGQDIDDSISAFRMPPGKFHWSKSEVSLFMGPVYHNQHPFTIRNYHSLLTKSVLLKTLNDSFAYNGSEDNYPDFRVDLAFQFSPQTSSHFAQHYHPVIKIGLSVFGQALAGDYFTRFKLTDSTSFYSQTYHDSGKVRSVTKQDILVSYAAYLLILTGSYFLQKDFHRWWTIYAGVEAGGGASFIDQGYIEYNEYYATDTVYKTRGVTSNSKSGNYSGGYQAFEYRYPGNIIVSLYSSLPVGIKYRVKDENDFWSRMRIYLEAAPGIRYTVIPAVKSFTAPELGLRIGVSFALKGSNQ